MGDSPKRARLEKGAGTKTVAVAMSGGVDSSVAAYLLKEQGFNVIGLTMRLFSREHGATSERSALDEQAVEDARAVCELIRAPHHVIDCSDVFRTHVIEPFVACYLSGSTPNPCANCNRHLKFSFLPAGARALGADTFATGHYVRLVPGGAEKSPGHGIPTLARGMDKDQSYFLWAVERKMLSGMNFPLGSYKKAQVRRIAEKVGFHQASDRPESREVCFVDSRTSGLESFIRHYMESKAAEKGLKLHPNIEPGPLVDTAGAELGTHRGSAFYTIGQRKGLGVALGHPAYVAAIEPETNTVVLSCDEKALMSSRFEASGVNYLVEPREKPFNAEVKVRYMSRPVPAVVTPLDRGRVKVETETPIRAVTPGQSVVFYERDILIGGAVIERQAVGYRL